MTTPPRGPVRRADPALENPIGPGQLSRGELACIVCGVAGAVVLAVGALVVSRSEANYRWSLQYEDLGGSRCYYRPVEPQRLSCVPLEQVR